jgi:hypothetical protein
MDFNQAIEKHAEWKIKFRQAITGKETMDAESISKDNCCELGKWLHGEAKSKFNELSSYVECLTKHAYFHVEAGKIAKTINARKYTEAEAMIGASSPYTAASSAVRHAIMHLKHEAKL